MTGPIFLAGFMAAGKTTVGRLAAARLGLEFIDLDDVVTQAAGLPVRELFAARGEAEFRRLESEALTSVLDRSAVVATGGGTPCHAENLATMRAHGLVVSLGVSLDDAYQRIGDPSTRPLLARPREEIADLYRDRLPIYRQAHAVLATEGRSPDEVADQVADLAARAAALGDLLPDSVLVALGERTCPIAIRPGAISRLGLLARAALDQRCRQVALVTDSNIDGLHGDAAGRALAAADFDVVQAVVPAGETAKSIDSFAALQGILVGAGLDRNSAVVALGGGVVGDLAGFAAATLYRGVPCIQVPTTLVAMIDSAIGGKTGINLDAGKNLVGAFHQPRLVLADPDLLATLPARERRAGFGELLKYALLDGEELYARVDALAPALAGDDWAVPPAQLAPIIRRAAGIKAAIVSADEREKGGERALLNLGHTVGHAIEAAAGYGTLLHGEAVALGLLAACRVSAALGLCPPALEERVAATLARAGLSTDIARWLTHDVLARVGVDKKRTGSRIGFIAVARPGDARVVSLELDRLGEIFGCARRALIPFFLEGFLMRLDRLALLGACCVALTPACTNDGGASLFIVQNQIPTEGCIIPSDVGAGFISRGVIEAHADTGYIFTPVVQSLLETGEQSEADRVIFIRGADVWLSFPRGELSDLPAFRQMFSGSVFPGGTASFGFEIVPRDVLLDIAGVIGDEAGVISVRAEIVMFGSVDGGDVEAEPYFYNLDVCNGCLVDDLGACSEVPDGVTIDQGGECQIFQDAPVDCCTDETLGVLCPAVVTDSA